MRLEVVRTGSHDILTIITSTHGFAICAQEPRMDQNLAAPRQGRHDLDDLVVIDIVLDVG